MDTLRKLFLENPLYVYISLAFAEIVLASMWYDRRGRKWAAALLIPLVLAGGIALLDRLVVTDREQILLASREIADDIEHGHLDVAEKYMDNNFGGFWGAKRLALEAGKKILSEIAIGTIKFRNEKVTVSGDVAEMHLATMVWFHSNSQNLDGQQPLTWTIKWIKRPEGWRIIQVDNPEQDFKM